MTWVMPIRGVGHGLVEALEVETAGGAIAFPCVTHFPRYIG
ncbi:hypothetical protein U2F10_02425 [Leptothoe sp. EHU-05/26/07-4]